MENVWIEWRGGECPVDKNAEVEIRLRDDYVSVRKAYLFNWNRGGDLNDDIITFRFAHDYDGDDTVKWREQNYCPVPPETIVSVDLENERTIVRRPASKINWIAQEMNPIISFRIVKLEDTWNVKEKKKQNNQSPSRINDLLWGSW